jgi:hypothetical protein
MKLKDLATVIRSKNASPFVLTIDIFFDDDEKYNLVKKSNQNMIHQTHSNR